MIASFIELLSPDNHALSHCLIGLHWPFSVQRFAVELSNLDAEY